MTLHLYKTEATTPSLKIHNVTKYTADQIVTEDGTVYGPLADDVEISVTPDCAGTLRADWRSVQKPQDLPLPLRAGVTPIPSASNSFRRSADGLVVVSVAVTDTGHVADLPEGCRPAAAVSSGGITVQPDGSVWVDGDRAGSVCFYAAI